MAMVSAMANMVACAAFSGHAFGLLTPQPEMVKIGSLKSCPRMPTIRAQAGAGDSVKVELQQQQQKGNGVAQQQQQQQPRRVQQRRDPLSPMSPFDLWDPFTPAARTFSQMLDMMVDGSAPSSSGPATTFSQRRAGGVRTSWDVLEDDDAFKMRVDMPGLKKDEIKIQIDDGTLVIRGEMKADRKEADPWAARGGSATYESRVLLPDGVDLGKIKAELQDGVLNITVPKIKAPPKKLIDIQVA